MERGAAQCGRSVELGQRSGLLLQRRRPAARNDARRSGQLFDEFIKGGFWKFCDSVQFLERVFQKTGTHQQSQLVAMLKTLQPLASLSPQWQGGCVAAAPRETDTLNSAAACHKKA